MKQIEDIAYIVQARLKSERVPNKMIRPFGGSNLFGIILDKLLQSDLIPSENIIASVHEDELFEEANTKRNIRTFKRSYDSANNDNDLKNLASPTLESLTASVILTTAGARSIAALHLLISLYNKSHKDCNSPKDEFIPIS